MREVWEETAVIPQSLTLFAHAKVTVHAAKPDNYKYPYPVSYLVVYLGRVGEIRPFLPTTEASARQLFPPAQAQKQDWVKRNFVLYHSALENMNGRK